MRRLIATLLLAAVGVLAAPVQAGAQPAPDVYDWARPLPDPSEPGVVVGSRANLGGDGGGGGGCTFRRDSELTARAKAELGFGDGAVYRYQCENGDVGFRWIPAADPVAPVVLARQAARSLQLPAPGIGMNPPAGQDQVVNLKTWLWLEGGLWTPRRATAAVPGVSATVTATPRRVVWVMGDGGRVICQGPGVRYDPARPASVQATSCGYTCRRSSASAPGGVFTVTVTVDWAVSWTASGAPGGGALPGVSRSASTTLRVAEVQALN